MGGLCLLVLTLTCAVGIPYVSAAVQSLVPAGDHKASDAPPGIIDYALNTTHLDPLVAVDPEKSLFYPSRANTGGKKLKLEMFESAEVCGACHQEIYTEWKESVMSKAWDDPIYRALLKRASIATSGKVDKL